MIAAHATPDAPLPNGAVKVKTENTASSGQPIAMYGRKRPNRERVRSAMAPIIGSLTASHRRAIIMMAETAAGARPTTSV